MKILVLCVLFLCGTGSPSRILGQSGTGARLAGIAYAAAALRDEWNMLANQAGIAWLEKPAFSAGTEMSHTQPGPATQAAVLVVPRKRYVFGASLVSYGFSAYREQHTGIACARKFGKKLAIALALNYHNIRITGYGTDGIWSVESGIQCLITDKLTIGAHVANPGMNGYHQEVSAGIPVTIGFGASYRYSPKLVVAASAQKTLDANTGTSIGVEYLPEQWFALRGGISSGPFLYFSGFGVRGKRLKIDAAVSMHPDLGYLPQLSVGYEF